MNVMQKAYLLLRDKRVLIKGLIMLALIVLVIGLGWKFYLKYLDEQGICWADGKALSNEELYQKAMRAFIQIQLNDVSALHDGSYTEINANEKEVTSYCSKRDCDVWTAPPATYKDILELKSKYSEDSVYIPITPDINTGYNELPKVLGWQRISDISEAGVFKQAHNSKTILLTTQYGATIFYPVDCCEIYTIAQWNTLVEKYPITSYLTDGHLPLDTRSYFVVKTMYSPEVSISYSGHYGRSFGSTKPRAYLYAINACGNIQKVRQTLELYPNLKE